MSGRQPPGHPRYPDPAYGSHSVYDRDPFTPGPPSAASHGQYYDHDSDMDHNFEHRDTFQSEGSAHNLVEDPRGDPRYYEQQHYDPYAQRRDTDTESEIEQQYPQQRYKSSNDSLLNQQRGVAASEVSTPTFNDYAPGAPREPYPAWGSDRQIPLSKEEIEDIFLDLTQKFGFQRDSMRNQFDFLMQLLDSRASRMTPEQALTTLHADYIGGPHANYRKWYFAAQLDLDDAVGQTQNPGVKRLQSMKRGPGGAARPATGAARSLESAINRWRQAMHQMSQYDRLRQLALYLLCWGEAAQTYKEKRTLLQLLVHFNRIWVIHISLFWYYTAYNSPSIYKKHGARDATAAMTWSATALGGAVSTVIMIFATLAEFTFIPTTWNNTSHLSRRLLFLLVTLGLTCGPTFYIGFVNDGSDGSSLPLILGIIQFFIAIIATLLFSLLPSGRMFGDRVAGKSRKYLASQTFTASYPTLTRNQRLGSIALWFIVFGCKFVESYFYLTLSIKDPIAVMTGMKIQQCSDRLFGNALCTNHAAFTLAIMFVMDLVLFFLDTYLWYVIWNTVFSIARSFSLGLSIWTPWKDIFTRLPKRIYAKILATGDMEVKYKPKVLVSQVWNAVIISMYREHLLSIDHVQKLLYHQVQSDTDGRRTLRAPPFFISQGDKAMQGEFFPAGSEAARRISFFAQSLTTSIPEPLPVDAMPTFTVLTPHYSEKILLSLREIIREEDHNTRVTLLEYLKQLHPIEWENFVKDTKILAEESAMFNGDNYLEECLKIRNVLGEFEQYHVSNQSPYAQWGHQEFQKSPVAIVGAREYIFSENIGILGDVAAGKEQTFGTLAARSLAWIGGKLHYGHPDFLNATFMSTRGGVSKAQKGLHLNEDIFAGMNAFGRGGRIKHTEYFQCGKGRDLGFGTVLNFQTKLGNGMAEQMLSREYYYLGTQLPIDRFLSFYYGHPGFHINNILVILSVQVFILALLFLGTLNEQVKVCQYSGDQPIAGQSGCYNLFPVFDWIKRCIISIFLVFAIAFLPLFLQELTERGAGRALLRLAKHFLSLSPIFEVFSTQIQSNSIITNMSFGGARYIATGRGFATSRISFSILYSRFAGPSIYLGMRTLIMLLYVTMTLWIPHLIYFWISVMSFVIAPFLFNPHQFAYSDFIIDYREFLRWMSRGNSRSHANSWIGYCRLSRTQITGYKKKRLGHPSEKLSGDVPRAGWRAVLLSEIIWPIVQAVILTIAYLFVKSFRQPDGELPPSPLVRLAIVSLGPIIWNAGVLLVLFLVSLFLGIMLNQCCPKFGAVMAMIAHALAVIGMIAFFEFLWFLESWNASHAVLGLIAIIAIQRAIHKILISVFISREFKHDETNRAWWT
ncbi:1,3-beta-D-glucan synthase, partial [Ceratobasidium sp. 394]